jgi:hypothetical protein
MFRGQITLAHVKPDGSAYFTQRGERDPADSSTGVDAEERGGRAMQPLHPAPDPFGAHLTTDEYRGDARRLLVGDGKYKLIDAPDPVSISIGDIRVSHRVHKLDPVHVILLR